MFKKRCRQISAWLLALTLACTSLATTALAGPAEQNVETNPASPDFMALGKYTIPTDIPGVFKVQLTIEPPEIKPAPVYVALVLDRSGSMGAVDMYNAAAGGFINRYTAVELAAQAFIDTLISSDNDDIHIDIIAYSTTAAGLTGGFLPLYTSPGVVDPGFSNLMAGGYMAGWASGGGTQTNLGMQMAHADFSAVSATIPANAHRYTLLLCDGDDSGANTGQITAALKAPVGTTTPYGAGMGNTIWSVVFGSDVTPNPNQWKSDWITSTASGTGTSTQFGQWIKANNPNALTGKYPSALAEPRMIGHSVDLPAGSAYASFPATNQPAAERDFYVAALGTPSSLTNVPEGNSHYYFSMCVDADHPTYTTGTATPRGGPYVRVPDGSTPALTVFEDFAKAAVGGAADTTATDVIGDSFQMYKMDGEDMLTLYSNDPDPTVNMEAKLTNSNTIKWTFDKLNGGFRYQLSFYVKYIGDPNATDYWYATNKEAYLEYVDANGRDVVKYFPVPYANPSTNATKAEDANNSVHINSPEEGSVVTPTVASIAPVYPEGSTGPLFSEGVLRTHVSSNKKIKITKDDVLLYQKTSKGAYKAVAKVKLDQTFVVLDELEEYYKVIFKKKDAEKSSVGYIKKSDAKLIEQSTPQTADAKVQTSTTK